MTRDPTRNSGKALVGPLREQTTVSFACSLVDGGGRGGAGWWGGQACSLYRLRVRVCPGVRLKEVFCPPLRWWCVQRTYVVPHFCSRPPDFAPGSSKVAVGSFSLLYLLSRICPNCASTQAFLVSWSFFVFYCLRRGVSRCKHCSIAVNGPRF